MDERKSYTLRRCHSLGPVAKKQNYRLSTRMKKVAPPPPAPGGVPSDQRPPLTNGDLRQSNREAPPILHHHNNHNHHPAMSTTPGEDCAFDELLEGRMELEVVLPDNRMVRMTVDRRTPMMDLLVHAATANKISPGGHVIRVVPKLPREQQEEEDHHHQRDVPYKPNTPVGSLDVTTVHIVPKPHTDIPVKRMPKLANQPFEQTFRLQVNLPRNQRMVLRVSPRITLSELKRQICNEKELDHSSHHLVHPAQPDTVLDLNSSLELYGCAEISLMSNSGLRDSIRSTSTHLISYSRVDDEKKKKGILRLFSKKKKETTIETNTNGLGSRGVSPTRNLSVSNRDSYQPKQSTKRKPAPAPPPPPVVQQQQQPPPSPPLVIQSSSSINSRPESEISAKTDEFGSTVSHSRHSSDSSGYHEPSVFSDCSQENKSPEASIVQGGGGGGISINNVLLCTPPKDVVPPDSLPLVSRQTTPVKEQQQTLTNLKTVPCCSNTSIVSATRKRKAPQPPTPPVLQEVETPSSPEDLSPIATTSKPIPDNQTFAQETLEESEASKVLEQVEEDESVTIVASPAQTPETTRQQKEVITYLDNVLRESETTTKSPTRLSPILDKSGDDDDIVSEKSSPEADIPIDKLEDDEHALSKTDDQMIETNVKDEPSASALSLESPADVLPSHPVDIASAEEDVVNEDMVDKISEFAISSSESERLPADDEDGKNEDHNLSPETDTSESPSVPLNKDILSQVRNSTVETSIQPNSQENNFVSDFKEKPKEQDLPGETECQNSNSEISETPNLTENKPSQEHLCIKSQCVVETALPLTEVQENQNQTADLEMANQDSSSVASGDTPRTQRKLVNFALGCYKSENKDIYDDKQEITSQQSSVSRSVINSSNNNVSNTVKKADSVAYKYRKPQVKIVPFEERSKTDSNLLSPKGQVQQRCTELSELSTMPLTGRSSSLYNLTPQKKVLEDKPKPMEPLPEGLKRTRSDQNLSQEVEEKLDFVQEQKRLHEEYLKLQAQFISWQKQLLNNQSLLQKEKMMPQMTFPALEQYKLQLENLPEILQLHNSNVNSEDAEELKTRSLPRQKSPSLSIKKFERPETPVVCQNLKQNSPQSPVLTQPCSEVIEQPKIECLDINIPSESGNTAIYAQVNKQKKTNKVDTVNVNTSEASNLSESPELPEKQSVVEDNSKSQTLPRPKTQPISAFDASRTMTLNRQARPKSQVVSVTIGSWQQRNQATPDIDSASVASSRSMFQSLENIPREHSKPTISATVENKSARQGNSASERKEKPTPPDVITAKVIVKRDGKDVIKDHKSVHSSSSNDSTQPKLAEVSKTVEVRKQSSKNETKPMVLDTQGSHSKPTKPLVHLSSMKDETRPPSIQVLKKWPLSDMSEKDTTPKTGERSIWDELKASAKRPSGSTKERVTRAEVDLRKHRTQKESSSKSPKNKDSEPLASKLHISKVNVNGESKTDNTKSSSTSSKSPATSGDSDKQRKPFPKSKSETFNAELKDVLFKRASSLAEQDTNSKPVESNYAELNGGSGNNAPNKTITVNGNSPPPPPPPPVSTMPTIPPAAPIPKSSQLLMGKRTKDSQTKVKSSTLKSKPTPSADPREELMLEIRGFGGRQALRKLFNKARLPLLKISPKKKASRQDPCTSSHPQ